MLFIYKEPTMKNNKVVYIHRKLSDSTIFYVGIGSEDRPYRKSGRSSLWNSTVNKNGYYVEVILEGLEWKEACEIETYLIKQFGRKDLRTGYLVNLTEGGDGTVGGKHSEESKKKMSEANKGNTYALGNKHSEETRSKMSEDKSKKVIDTVTGEVYVSVIEASKAINVNYKTLSRWLIGYSQNKSNLIYLK